jgi:hypothetical protein
MMQIIMALMLMQNVSSFSTTESPAFDSINKIQKTLKVVRIVNGLK